MTHAVNDQHLHGLDIGNGFRAIPLPGADGVSPSLAVVRGQVRAEEIVLVRLHHECLAGDVFVSTRCECRANMQRALTWIAGAGTGVLLYLRGTGVCPQHGEHPPDGAAVATAMLDWLGIRRVRLLLDVDEGPPEWLQPAGVARLREVSPHGLTARELQVLNLLASGLVTKQIAERLAISRRTAAHHIEHIYAKIGASTRAAAAAFAVENGISAY